MQSDDPDFETEGGRRDRAVRESAATTRPCSPSTRKRRFKRSTASIPCCRCRRGAPSGTASSTTGTARSRCSPRSTRSPAKCSGRPCRGTPARRSSSSSATSSPASRSDARFTSSPTTCRPTRRRPCARSCSTHPNVHLHFTPTYSSWLNQVELWFAKIERDLLARGIFTSVADLARKIRRYIRHYNKARETDPLELSQSGASNW